MCVGDMRYSIDTCDGSTCVMVGHSIPLEHSARVAQLVERSPSKAKNPGSNPGWGHDPAVGVET